MPNIFKLGQSFIVFAFLFLAQMSLSACQSVVEAQPTELVVLATDSGVNQAQPADSTQLSAGQAQAASTSTAPSQDEPIPDPQSSEAGSDPADIEAGWQSSPHANTFVLDSAGQNNTCARCHAPINWMPAMDDLPESCFACKFELEDPPPLIPETDWEDVPCKVCHLVDKKDNIQPEVAWLEIAPLGEYAAVASPSELCLKCHVEADVPQHPGVTVGGAHAGYECTSCHSAHDTSTSCAAADCHNDVIEPADPIPGHDADHQAVACVACHDGSGMQVGPDEESGLWTTFASGLVSDGGDSFAFTSHNTVLEASCDRCHFAGNPWELTESVIEP